MNKTSYVEKMNVLLSDSSKFKTFSADKRVKNNPFIYFEEKFNRSIKQLLDDYKISDEVYLLEMIISYYQIYKCWVLQSITTQD